MTDFEMFSFGIFTGIILALLIIFVLVLRDNNNDDKNIISINKINLFIT